MSNERMRNKDASNGDVLVNDSIASGRPDLPIHDAPVRDTSIAIDADQLGERHGGHNSGGDAEPGEQGGGSAE
jgi:hypothetical protein